MDHAHGYDAEITQRIKYIVWFFRRFYIIYIKCSLSKSCIFFVT